MSNWPEKTPTEWFCGMILWALVIGGITVLLLTIAGCGTTKDLEKTLYESGGIWQWQYIANDSENSRTMQYRDSSWYMIYEDGFVWVEKPDGVVCRCTGEIEGAVMYYVWDQTHKKYPFTEDSCFTKRKKYVPY